MRTGLRLFKYISFCIVVLGIFIFKAPSQETFNNFENEAWKKVSPEFVEKHTKKSYLEGDTSLTQKKVRFVYLVPQDRSIREDYKAAIADVALHLQDFYQKELGNSNAFTLNEPLIEIYQTSHTAEWYRENPPRPQPPQPAYSSYFYENALNDGFALSGGRFNDPNNRWIYYIDADPNCTQFIGGTHGIALMAGNDLRGLTGQNNIPACAGQSPDAGGKYRWLGGAGHEIGHSFDLPHPPGCDPPTNNCQGGQTAINSLMWFGFSIYPNTYFLAADRSALLNSGFFSSINLQPSKFVDYDNDLKADVSVWRPGNGVWYILQSSNNQPSYSHWGSASDRIVPGDYDGDRKTDIAVWRPSDGTWYIIKSSDNTFIFHSFGLSEDIPVPSDYDGDRKTDIAVWRPGNGTWYLNKSATNTVQTFAFGTNGDKPVPSDYNGDKRADIAVFRPSNSIWYIHQNYLSYYYYTNPPTLGQVTFTAANFGYSDDRLVPGDYDGDNRSDIAVWRASDGTWYYLRSSDSQFQAFNFGITSDIPSPADYDNDGKLDFAVWRPSNGIHYIWQSSGGFIGSSWGIFGDVPAASAFVR